MSIEITMIARYAGRCIECKQTFDKDAFIKFNTFKKTAKHVKCHNPQPKTVGLWRKATEDREMKEGKNDEYKKTNSMD